MTRPSEITLGEAFLSKEIDIEGNIFSVFDVAEHLFHCSKGQRQRIRDVTFATLLGLLHRWKAGKRNSLQRDRSAIAYHYDQPIGFYRPWLGESLAYSCAYFRSATDSIDVAQSNKLDLICRKLRLQPCDRFLDIGCGWGSLVLHAASRYDVYAHGITLSREQAAVASARIQEARLTQSCEVELLDYREAPDRLSTFDKIASVGMCEHVGLKNLPLYFQTAHQLLRPGGVFLNHGIARSSLSQGSRASFLDRLIVPFLRDTLLLRRPRNASFIDKHVFPDGELVTISQALRAAESAGFEVRDVENLREHYELTLRRWVEGSRKNADTVSKEVSEATYRTWLLYMAGSAAAFRRGDIGVYQVLLSRPDQGNSQIPLTREDWYSSTLFGQEVEV
jgi:cyclopropane-fatty-acyl-phospholipid synthase